MTTETLPDIFRSIGRLEGNQEQTNARLDRIEARLDRLTLALLGVGATIVAALVAIAFKLFLGT